MVKVMKHADTRVMNPQGHFHLQWHLTERCNLRCRHCYMDKALMRDELGCEEVISILRQYYGLVRAWKMQRENSRISWTGGEPFLRQDLFKILDQCARNYALTQYGLLTNGYFLSKSNVAQLASLCVDYVQVSIEGTPATNDFIRGAGAYKTAVAGLERLIGAGINTSISMTVNKRNVKDVPAMIGLAKKMGVAAIGLRRFIPYGRGKAMSDLLLSPQETRGLFEYIASIRSANQEITIVTGCEDGIAAANMHYYPNGCVCGYDSLTVLPNGIVYPCRRLPVLVGDLRRDTLKTIYLKSRSLNAIRNIDHMNDDCLKCPFFNECLGGAKCVGYAYWGALGGGDPQCWRRFESLPSRTKIRMRPKASSRMVRYF